LGKTVINAAGDELGKGDDIELNWEEKTVQNLIIKGDHEIKQKVMA
jgi:sporulation protein YlmC with PRC-barrel domain